MQRHAWWQVTEADNSCVYVFLHSSALPTVRDDPKWAFHHVPQKSCREGNNEAKKKPRDSQVHPPTHTHLFRTVFRYFSCLCLLCFIIPTLRLVFSPGFCFLLSCLASAEPLLYRVCVFSLTLFLCHRRIDVSPRAFKKHSQLFEAVKSSEDDAYKVTERSAVWSLLEAHEWPNQRPLDYILFKASGFPWREVQNV